MRAPVFGMLLLLTTCIDDRLETCGDLTCPIDSTCRADQCATEAQVAACEGRGLAEDAPCGLDEGIGVCKEGACRPTCGDGKVASDGLEQCDDHNTSNCGECSADCGVLQNARQATGAIEGLAGSELGDGQTFTLDDGFGAVVTFEFVSDGELSDPANVAIAFTTTIPGDTVAVRIRNRILEARSSKNLAITASATNGFPTVFLTNDRASSLGNRPITRSTGAPFAVRGMSGGVAGNCPINRGCSSALDCASNKCVDFKCVQ